jgi:hypothetical protein
MDKYGRAFHDQRVDESDDSYRIRKSNEYVKSIGAKAYNDSAPDARVDPEGSARWMRENRPSPDEGQPTLRDQFAMAALPALIADQFDYVRRVGNKDRPVGQLAARFAYEIADFMMEARKK